MVCSGGGRRGGKQEYPEVRPYVESERVANFNRGIACWRRDNTRIEVSKAMRVSIPPHRTAGRSFALWSIRLRTLQLLTKRQLISASPVSFTVLNRPDVASCESIRGQSVCMEERTTVPVFLIEFECVAVAIPFLPSVRFGRELECMILKGRYCGSCRRKVHSWVKLLIASNQMSHMKNVSAVMPDTRYPQTAFRTY